MESHSKAAVSSHPPPLLYFQGGAYSPHGGQRHQAPPEGVEEGPGAGGVVFLREVDQGGEGEDGHPHQQHQQAQLLVGLVQGVDERLQPSEVTDQLEDPHHPHHPHQSHDFTRFTHYLEIL